MFALIHSPLVGSSTWQPVAEQLQQQGYQVIVPALNDTETGTRSFWEQEAESAAESINAANSSEANLLVGHSGAGPILPAIGARLKRPPAGYIFVDAGLPQNQATRLELMRAESPQWAADFEKYLLDGGRFPAWTEADLQQLIPDVQLRQQLLAELRPRGLSFFTERISSERLGDNTYRVHPVFEICDPMPGMLSSQVGLIRFNAVISHVVKSRRTRGGITNNDTIEEYWTVI
jgi:hypothetical protein